MNVPRGSRSGTTTWVHCLLLTAACREPKGNDNVWSFFLQFRFHEVVQTTAGNSRYILRAIFSQVGKRRRDGIVGKSGRPQLCAGFRIKCAELLIRRTADKQQTTGSHDGAT